MNRSESSKPLARLGRNSEETERNRCRVDSARGEVEKDGFAGNFDFSDLEASSCVRLVITFLYTWMISDPARIDSPPVGLDATPTQRPTLFRLNFHRSEVSCGGAGSCPT